MGDLGSLGAVGSSAWASLGSSGAKLGNQISHEICEKLEAKLSNLGPPNQLQNRVRGGPGGHLGGPGSVLEGSRGVLGAIWGVPGASWRGPGGVREAS